MGYFSNGSEGDWYQQRWCAKCVHHDNCAVWDAHMWRNYDEATKTDSILHDLIPRATDGLSNDKCKMFWMKS